MELVNEACVLVAIFAAACANPSVPIGGGDAGSTGTMAGSSSTTGPTGGSGGGSTVGAGGAPPTGSWQNVTSNLANMPSECGNMTSVSVKPDEDVLIAGVATRGLWASTDGGASWSALGSGAGSAKITNRPTALVFDPQDKRRYWEAGIYNGGGVYETLDDGTTFTQVGMVAHVDLASIDFTDPDRKTLVAGGHEQPKTLYRSTDSGMTWTNVGQGLPESSYCSLPLALDAQTYVVGCGGFSGGPIGLMRTEDGGSNWSRVSTAGGGAAPLTASDGSIYWPTFAGGGMVRSTDQGRTWTETVGSGVITGAHPVELPDGRLATFSGKTIVTSSDHGVTWRQATTPVPIPDDPVGLAYSAGRKAFFAWYFSCSNPVPPDAIQRYDFDYQTN